MKGGYSGICNSSTQEKEAGRRRTGTQGHLMLYIQQESGQPTLYSKTYLQKKKKNQTNKYYPIKYLLGVYMKN